VTQIELERGHVRNQSLTYFGVALLLMTSIGNSLKFIKPTFGFTSGVWPVPLPYIDIGSWPIVIIDLLLLCFSLFFMSALFISRWMKPALRLSSAFRYNFLALLPFTFLITVLKGLVILQNIPRPWFEVFFWSGMLLFLSLYVINIKELLLNKSEPERDAKPHDHRLSLIKNILDKVLPKRKSCLDCGYLSRMMVVDTNGRQEEQSPNQFLRAEWKKDKTVMGIQELHCYRRIWDNQVDALPDEQHKVIRIPRFCSKYFRYAGGSPGEHMETHRARTQRRWVIAGALIGPYIATSAGYIASNMASRDGDPVKIFWVASLGLIGVIIAVLVINLVFNKT
jgi:hypothetical protein